MGKMSVEAPVWNNIKWIEQKRTLVTLNPGATLTGFYIPSAFSNPPDIIIMDFECDFTLKTMGVASSSFYLQAYSTSTSGFNTYFSISTSAKSDAYLITNTFRNIAFLKRFSLDLTSSIKNQVYYSFGNESLIYDPNQFLIGSVFINYNKDYMNISGTIQQNIYFGYLLQFVK